MGGSSQHGPSQCARHGDEAKPKGVAPNRDLHLRTDRR